MENTYNACEIMKQKVAAAVHSWPDREREKSVGAGWGSAKKMMLRDSKLFMKLLF